MPGLRRTILYIPADNERALAKAASLPADALIIDLEDAVAPDAKETAREAARVAIPALAVHKTVALRINGADTPWHQDDLALAAELGGPVVVPKVRDADEVRAIARRAAPVWPMMETAQGIFNALPIARAAAATGEAALIIGTNDLALELQCEPGPGRANLMVALQTIVLAGRAAGCQVIDGVMNDFRDEDGLVAETRAAKALGMSGKTVIHPSQVGPVNTVFSPSAEEVERAKAVLSAMELARANGRSVATLDGRMIEQLHADAAARVLALAEAVDAA